MRNVKSNFVDKGTAVGK